jgi:hypothetical protein
MMRKPPGEFHTHQTQLRKETGVSVLDWTQRYTPHTYKKRKQYILDEPWRTLNRHLTSASSFRRVEIHLQRRRFFETLTVLAMIRRTETQDYIVVPSLPRYSLHLPLSSLTRHHRLTSTLPRSYPMTLGLTLLPHPELAASTSGGPELAFPEQCYRSDAAWRGVSNHRHCVLPRTQRPMSLLKPSTLPMTWSPALTRTVITRPL